MHLNSPLFPAAAELKHALASVRDVIRAANRMFYVFLAVVHTCAERYLCSFIYHALGIEGAEDTDTGGCKTGMNVNKFIVEVNPIYLYTNTKYTHYAQIYYGYM